MDQTLLNKHFFPFLLNGSACQPSMDHTCFFATYFVGQSSATLRVYLFEFLWRDKSSEFWGFISWSVTCHAGDGVFCMQCNYCVVMYERMHPLCSVWAAASCSFLPAGSFWLLVRPVLSADARLVFHASRGRSGWSLRRCPSEQGWPRRAPSLVWYEAIRTRGSLFLSLKRNILS